ncbi:peptidase U32 family protein [Aquibacillus sediminis]|uniref:peptidase U32 family protein n=1 Tax=Aquibacillus sediminis TaxID=2574734 RepID=UPI001109857D|nr:peptidase U32 family protein [Aquibacillus sediminis]
MSNYQPELIATARDIEEVKTVAEAGADAVVIGHERYGLRVAGNFDVTAIGQAVQHLHACNKKVYVLTNAIFHNDIVQELPDYFTGLAELEVDGIICGDPSVFPILNELDVDLDVFWNPETLSTNYETLKYWETKGIKRAILSNELALDAIATIKEKINVPVEIQIHGMTCIFQSKRKLVTNYYNYIETDEQLKQDIKSKNMHLRQSNETDTHYPVYEDINGTHIMSNEDLCMIEHLQEIMDARVDSLRINGLFKSREYQQKAVALYREAIDRHQDIITDYQKHQLKQQIVTMQPNDRKLDTGFYYKEQIY